MRLKCTVCLVVSGMILVAVSANGQKQSSPASISKDEAVRHLSEEVRHKGWIVFCGRSDKGDWDLFLCRPDGSSLHNITNTTQYNEVAPQFSRDGRTLLYRRLPREEQIDGNHYGTQGRLVFANSDGTSTEVFGENGQYPWASWSQDGKQLVCLSIKEIFFVDITSRQVIRRLERKGFFQQLTLSPDGRWLSGVANSFGTGWSVARIDVVTGAANAVSQVDCCTPDWFPDSNHLIFSNRPQGQKANNGYGWTQLWMADAEGKAHWLVYGEEGRHIYGGNVSPDGKYVVFTGNMQENGDTGNTGAPMALMRLADAPIIGGESSELRSSHPEAKSGPLLVLPVGWEPCWTFTEIDIGRPLCQAQNEKTPNATSGIQPVDGDEEIKKLAAEVHDKGWIVFSGVADKGNWDLFLMRPDGSDRRQITDTPKYNEAGARFSPDGRKLLYFRLPGIEQIDNNTYATYELVIANSDGSEAVVCKDGFHWASWGPDSNQIACLDKKGIRIIDLLSQRILREIPRQGIVQQLIWSPDGRWFVGTANGLGVAWSIGRLNADIGQINAVSETDRYNCTPDWLPDSRRIIYTRGIVPNTPDWAQLWVANGNGQEKRLLYAEEGRHIYGGCVSPDGKFTLFTRSEEDLGKVDNSRTKMAIIRWKDTPMAGGHSESLHKKYPSARSGPLLDLSWGWEPHWTYSDVIAVPRSGFDMKAGGE